MSLRGAIYRDPPVTEPREANFSIRLEKRIISHFPFFQILRKSIIYFFSSPFFLRSAKRTAKAKRRARKRAFFLRLKLSRGSFPPSKPIYLQKNSISVIFFRSRTPCAATGLNCLDLFTCFFNVKIKIGNPFPRSVFYKKNEFPF